MQAIGNLNQHHPDIIADGQQQFAEVLRLLTGLITKHTSADFRQSAYNLGDLIAKQTRYVLYCVIGVLHYVVQQRGTDTRATQTNLLNAYTRDSKRMHDIRLAAQTTNPIMRLVREIKSMGNKLHLLAVRSMCIVV